MKLSELKAEIAKMENVLERVKAVRDLNRETVLFEDDIDVVGYDGESEWELGFDLVYEHHEATWSLVRIGSELDPGALPGVLNQPLEPGYKARVYVQVELRGEASLPDIIPEHL